jgi:hypothetical protein
MNDSDIEGKSRTDVLVLDVFEEFELAVGSFA